MLNNQIEELKKKIIEVESNLSMLTVQKQQIQSTLNIWKLEYLNLTDR